MPAAGSCSVYWILIAGGILPTSVEQRLWSLYFIAAVYSESVLVSLGGILLVTFCSLLSPGSISTLSYTYQCPSSEGQSPKH